ncbi:uncharacterized protein B0H18DRAFT_281115 [Fomitopsis serialis]|uniref:uncharacterized protein n=1 Tax=Fomitopsis serialis TaxID=139415 RepID=UPI002008345D|nr:uncharacterized protein B0H18DRAFT_281115 [Neoantrodia serialis]KAH9927617.1 hypothetical protein B0H18DRAFT_281115 [Neoantrodia serialis]
MHRVQERSFRAKLVSIECPGEKKGGGRSRLREACTPSAPGAQSTYGRYRTKNGPQRGRGSSRTAVPQWSRHMSPQVSSLRSMTLQP